MRTDTMVYLPDRHLHLAIVDCFTPDIYLFEIEYIDQIQADVGAISPNQLFHLNCHFRVSPSEFTDYSRENTVDLREVTGAICDTFMEILRGRYVAIACKFLADGSGDVLSERIRNRIDRAKPTWINLSH